MTPIIHIIGAPTDAGASQRGAVMGPEALRVAGLLEGLRTVGCKVIDGGNVQGPANPMLPVDPLGGYRHLDEVLAWTEQAHAAVGLALQQGHLPMLLGGDHALAIGSVSAVAKHCRDTGKHLRVIWLDAHADANTPAMSPSGNLHGMPVSVLCGHGPQVFQAMTHLDGVPAMSPQALRMLAVRSVDAQEREWVHAQRIEIYDMRYIDEHGMRAVMHQALMGVDPHTHHLHLSLDADGLDPGIAPGVGTPVPGGLNYREAQLCMEMLADSGALRSVDVVELNPACDHRNQTAQLLVDLLQSLFGKSTLIRPTESASTH
jgi:arginase